MDKQRQTELVIKAQQGNKDALNELIGDCYQDIYYFAYKTVKNEDIAADITQESCIEITGTLDKLREPAAFSVWARRITYHQCTRYFREAPKEVQLEENEDGETILDVLPDDSDDVMPEKVTEDKEFQQIMQDMLNSLPAEQRSSLLLYYYEKRSVKEIAEIHGTTEGTVKSRLNYGRKAVKKKVEEYEEKSGTRLHSVAILPLLISYLFEQSAAELPKISLPILSGMAGTAAATAAAGSASATGTAASAVGGVAVKSAASALGIKIVGGVLAAAVVVGAAVGGSVLLLNSNSTEPAEGEAAISSTPEPSQLPDTPTEAMQYMNYHTAYNSLEDVTELVETTIMGIPSSTASTGASITEFTTQAELEALYAQYANLGYRDSDEIHLTEGDYRFALYNQVESKATDNRYFWLDNPEYSAYIIPKIDSVRYDADTDSLYVMLAYSQDTYHSYEQLRRNYFAITREVQSAYYTVSLSIGNTFTEPVEHIAFVSPEKKAISRTDINVSVVEYDEKYTNFEPFNYYNNGLDPDSYCFPSTQIPTETNAEVITSKEMFVSLLEEYNDIIDQSDDTVIFEPCIVDYIHRFDGFNGLSKYSDGELLNLFISSPELDAQNVVVAGNLMSDKNNPNQYTCAIFYNAATQTAYFYTAYTGYPMSQYEKYRDGILIEENSKATYLMLSIEFMNDEDHPVSNIVIVLPEKAN